MSATDTKRLESIEKLPNYVVYLLIFEAGLTIGLVYLMQQLVGLLSYWPDHNCVVGLVRLGFV